MRIVCRLVSLLFFAIGPHGRMDARDCKCSANAQEYCVNGYYVHWLSVNVVALRPNDVVKIANEMCGMVRFKVASDHDISRLVDSVASVSASPRKGAADEMGIDCKLVFVVQRKGRRDTLSFGRSSFMYVNKQKMPLCVPLMRALVQRLPYWQAQVVLSDPLLNDTK